MMRKLLLIAAAFAAVAPGVASAAPVIAYTPNVGGTFGNTNPNTFPPNFRDVYTFVTTFARSVTIDITSSYADGKANLQNVNFISNGVKLNAKVIPVISTGQFEERYLANFRIPAGLQRILVSGSSKVDGSYSGILTLSGVPEPSTWAMMILGFGLAGAAVRRRSSKERVSFA